MKSNSRLNIYIYIKSINYLLCVFVTLNIKTPKVRPLVERDTKSLEQMLPEIPMWVKNPDHDRVCIPLFIMIYESNIAFPVQNLTSKLFI